MNDTDETNNVNGEEQNADGVNENGEEQGTNAEAEACAETVQVVENKTKQTKTKATVVRKSTSKNT